MDAGSPSSDTSLRLEQDAGDDVGITDYTVVDYGSGYVAPIGSWIHLAFTSDASNARVYVNGVLTSTAPRAFDLTVDKLGTSNAFRNRSLLGLLDEVQIYDRVLTEPEIASLAVYSGRVRSDSGRALDGDFSGSFPSGDGTDGGDFISTFAIVPELPSVEEGSGGGNRGCGALGLEFLVPLGLISLLKRRRRATLA